MVNSTCINSQNKQIVVKSLLKFYFRIFQMVFTVVYLSATYRYMASFEFKEKCHF